MKDYFQSDGSDIHWSYIQVAVKFVAGIAITPMRGNLGLGSEVRLNLPGKAKGDWDWRLIGAANSN